MSSMRTAVRTLETQESGEMGRLRCAECAHPFASETFNRRGRAYGDGAGGTPAEGNPS
jgi:hypothetical protein